MFYSLICSWRMIVIEMLSEIILMVSPFEILIKIGTRAKFSKGKPRDGLLQHFEFQSCCGSFSE